MIRAGTIDELTTKTGHWLILDIGFANKSKSCGLMINENAPLELQFTDAVSEIITFINQHESPINLIVEAPLSVSFDSKGNPKGRKIERQGSKTRYWYVGLGSVVMVAAMYLLKAIVKGSADKEIRLFEGFVSFKDKNVKSNHSLDVALLREVVDAPEKFKYNIIDPADLRMDETDSLQSAFSVAGLDTGIPPVIIRF